MNKKWGGNLDSELVSAGIGFVGAILGAGAGYFGSIGGAKLQIKEEKRKLREENEERKKEIEEQRKLYEYAIDNFLRNEIKNNFVLCFGHGGGNLLRSLEMSDQSFSSSFAATCTQCKFDEYNKLKYELVKLGGNKVQEIIDIYDMFYLVVSKRDLQNFFKEEYDQFKKTYKLCFEKYYKA